MTQYQSNKFHLPFNFRFGTSNAFLPAKPEVWPLAAHYFEPCCHNAEYLIFYLHQSILRLPDGNLVKICFVQQVQYRSEISELRIRSPYAHIRMTIHVYAYDHTRIHI